MTNKYLEKLAKWTDAQVAEAKKDGFKKVHRYEFQHVDGDIYTNRAEEIYREKMKAKAKAKPKYSTAGATDIRPKGSLIPASNKGRVLAVGALAGAAYGGYKAYKHLQKKAGVNVYLEKIAKDYQENENRTGARGALQAVGGGLVGDFAARKLGFGGIGRAVGTVSGAIYGGTAGAAASRDNQRREHYSSEILKNKAEQSGYHTQIMKRKAEMAKQAELSDQAKLDIASTATIGAAGAITNTIADKILHPNSPHGSSYKAALLGGGLGLIGDYGAVKVNNLIAEKIGSNP